MIIQPSQKEIITQDKLRLVNVTDLSYTSMYYFRYMNPSTKNLHIWDTAPIIIPLFVGPRHLLALNLHWIMPRFRHHFIELAIKINQRSHLTTTDKNIARIFYNTMKTGRLKFGVNGIRRYHLYKIAQLQEIPQQLWTVIDPTYGKYAPHYRIKNL